MLQIALTLIFYVWLIIVLVLLYLMWRDGSRRIMRLQQALIDMSNKSADAAKTAADAAQQAVAHLPVEKKRDA